jgi:cytochrome c
LPTLKPDSVVLAAALLVGCGAPPPTPMSQAPSGSQVLVEPAAGQPRLLLFSRTAAFRHDAIPAGIRALTDLARQQGLGLTATEDASELSDDELAPFGAVIFLNTTGDALGPEPQAAFERYIRAGRGFVGVHAAGHIVIEQALPIAGEGRVIPTRLSHVHVEKPTKQQVVVDLLAELPLASHRE